ncbi:MAG: hypothetical protein M3O91_10210, partial [Chloroflexota bacterium]|nr:hypothetical protein [Chloroflexota bacterium]
MSMYREALTRIAVAGVALTHIAVSGWARAATAVAGAALRRMTHPVAGPPVPGMSVRTSVAIAEPIAESVR